MQVDMEEKVFLFSNYSAPYLKFSWLICSVGFDKLARRARTQIRTDYTQILGTPNYGVPSHII